MLRIILKTLAHISWPFIAFYWGANLYIYAKLELGARLPGTKMSLLRGLLSIASRLYLCSSKIRAGSTPHVYSVLLKHQLPSKFKQEAQ